MARVKSETTYTIEITDDEYFIILQCLESEAKKQESEMFSVHISLALLLQELKESRI